MPMGRPPRTQLPIHTRSKQGGGSRRLGRPRNTPSRNRSFDSASGAGSLAAGSMASRVFHQQAQEDDLSQYQFSIDPSRVAKDHAAGAAQKKSSMEFDSNGQFVVDGMTMDDEDVYTYWDQTTIATKETTLKINWEEVKMQEMTERQQRMMMAGKDNSIPKLIGGGFDAAVDVSSRSFRASTPSLAPVQNNHRGGTFAPTEEESYQGTEGETTSRSTTTGGNSSVETPQRKTTKPTRTAGQDLMVIQSSRTLTSVNDNNKENNSSDNHSTKLQKKKRAFMVRLWKALFSVSKKPLSASQRRRHLTRQSAPALRMSAKDLWGDESGAAKKHATSSPALSANAAARRRNQSLPPSSAAIMKRDPVGDVLWTPPPQRRASRRQLQQGPPSTRGVVPLAKLKRTASGRRVWQNSSGRIFPFSAAEF